MKYKQIIIILLLSTMLLITACSNLSGKKDTEEITPMPLQRTTYIGYSDASDHGYAMAMITLKDDKMTHVVLKEFTELSVEKDFSVYEYARRFRLKQCCLKGLSKLKVLMWKG